MKKLNIALISLAFLFYCQNANAQTLNWYTIDSTARIINVSVGWDYSLSYSVGYGYKLNTKLPVVIGGSFSMPSGKRLLDDFKTKIGGQIQILNRSNFAGAISIYGIYRRHETRYVTLQNFGSDIKGTIGYYNPKWFLAGEFGFDKAIVSHFKHSKEFKENIYADVVDGWFEPSTGGNFNYGLQAGYSFKKADLTLNLGKVVTQDFRSSPLIPAYVALGFNYRL